MAKLKVSGFTAIGTESSLTAVSWKVTTDAEGLEIVDKNIHDVSKKLEWSTPLPIPGKPGEFYKEHKDLYGWIKLHFSEQESPWELLSNEDQTTYEITYRIHEKDGTITIEKIPE